MVKTKLLNPKTKNWQQDQLSLTTLQFEFLKYSYKKYLTFICTGTPQNEIESILNYKGLSNFFNKVYGSPQSKESIIEEIILENNLKKDDVLFFGDAMTDYNACLKCGINFIGIENDDTNFPENTQLIKDFNDILIKDL